MDGGLDELFDGGRHDREAPARDGGLRESEPEGTAEAAKATDRMVTEQSRSSDQACHAGVSELDGGFMNHVFCFS